MTKKELKKLIEDGESTNIDVAEWLGAVIERGTTDFYHTWDTYELHGESYRVGNISPTSHRYNPLPNWLGCTDDALSLVPEGDTISMNTFMKGSATVDLYDNIGTITRVLHASLPTAIVLAILETHHE